METATQTTQNSYLNEEKTLFRRNETDAVADVAKLLNAYAEAVLKYLENSELVYGSAVCMRKATELMGAYLWNYTLNGLKNETIRDGGIIGGKPHNDPIWRSFISQRSSLMNEAGGKQGLNYLMHYQAAAEPESTYREKEKSDLLLDQEIYLDSIPKFQQMLKDFFIRVPILGRSDAIAEAQYLSELLALEITEGKRQQILGKTKERIEKFWSEEGSVADPWLSYQCHLLHDFEAAASQELTECDLVNIVVRRIAERTTSRFVMAHGGRIKTDEKNERKNTGNKKDKETLEDYFGLLATCESKGKLTDEQKAEANDIGTYGPILGRITNERLHWHDGSWDDSIPKCMKKNLARLFDNEQRQMYEACGHVIRADIVGKQPELKYVHNWIDKTRIEKEEQKKEFEEIIKKTREEHEKKIQEARIRLIRQKRIIITLSCVAAVLFLVAAVLIGRAVQQNNARKEAERVYTYAYADYIMRDGVPEGVGELTAEQAAGSRHYEASVRDGLLREMRCVDANGKLMNEHLTDRMNRPAKIEVDYDPGTTNASQISFYDDAETFLVLVRYDRDENGKIVHMEFLDQNKHALLLPASVTHIKFSDWNASAIEESGYEQSSVSDIRVSKTRDGLIEEISFGWNTREQDNNGVTGIRFDYYQDGRIKSTEYVYGNVDNDMSVLQRRDYLYDGLLLTDVNEVFNDGTVNTTSYQYVDGLCTGEMYSDITGEARSNRVGAARMDYAYDNNGRVSWRRIYNGSGSLMTGVNGWAEMYQAWDEQGRNTETAYYDAFENPIMVGEWARRTIEYNENTQTVRWYDADGIMGYGGKDYAYGILTRAIDPENRSMKSYRVYKADGTPVLYHGAYEGREIIENGDLVESGAFDADGNRMFSGALGYAYCENDYTNHRLTERRFYDEDGQLINDKEGIARTVIQYTPDWHSEEDIWNYNADGDMILHKHFVYTDGKLTGEECLDSDGNLVLESSLGYARKRYSFRKTDDGTETITSFEGTDGQLIIALQQGDLRYAGIREEFDTNGYLLRRGYFNDKEELLYNPNTGCYIEETLRDARGNLIEARFLDGDGELMMSGKGDGFARVIQHFNANNQMDELAYYDAEGNLVIPPEYGYARRQREFDSKGNCIRVSFYDDKGQLLINEGDGFASASYKYDDAGNIEEARYFDAAGDLFFRNDLGYAWVTQKFDNAGHLIKATYYGTGTKSIINPLKGYAGVEFKYDDTGRMTEWWYYGPEGELMVCPLTGYCGIIEEYDDAGNVSAWTYYGTDEKPMINEMEGYSRNERAFDENGNIVAVRAFDALKQPMVNLKTGYAVISREMDSAGRTIEEHYFGTDGEPMINKIIGCVATSWVYNEEGRKTQVHYFGTDGKPMINEKIGCAGIVFGYDEAGNEISRQYQGVAGNPIMNSVVGCAAITRELDDTGRTIEEHYFGTDGKPMINEEKGCAGIAFGYDEAGNEISRQYQDAAGNPIMNSVVGYAAITRELDEEGRTLEEHYFGTDDKPMINEEKGCAVISWVYDEEGRATEMHYFGTDGKPVISKVNGCASVSRVLDEEGRTLEEHYYGTDGKPMINEEKGCAATFWVYDEDGRIIEYRYYGTDGEPMINHLRGYACLKHEFNTDGKITLEEYLGEDNQLMIVLGKGYAGRGCEYDELSRVIKVWYYGPDREPVVNPELGYATAEYVYDGNSTEITEVRYFDAEGKLMKKEENEEAA